MTKWTLLSEALPEDGRLVRVHPAGKPDAVWTVALFTRLEGESYRFNFAGNAEPQEVDAWKPITDSATADT